ncbi:MAG: MarR family winged helix-turn-helix transcriptional regulator [Rhodospirillales bacterium]|tara:strand:+ start:917 stop:1378 length:462 start_codon:yes stop_codon:yes gene_type:complete
MTKQSIKNVNANPNNSAGLLIRDTMMHLQVLVRAKIKDDDLSTAQYFLLRILWETEGLSQRELSDRVCTTEPTTQSAILRMEKQGLVKRSRNEEDKRAYRVYLTKKGRNLRQKLVPSMNEINKIINKDIKGPDRRLFMQLIRKMRQNLRDEIF